MSSTAALIRLGRHRCSTRLLTHSTTSTRAFSVSAARSADPWLLPNTPEHVEKTTSPADAPAPTPLPRPGEPVAQMRARLVYQSRKRGTLESDLLLSTFAQERLATMDEGELHEFDKLMDEPDWDIYYWATGKRTPPERWANSRILDKLREHVRNEGKVVRRMPDLS
ncbi:Flavinator of succinate dehydrogenase-domain-containing protein [Trametes maxima]|nr:Flavinator of succinate dehydrogenase-domain-containing protein [Trametes maxima]